MFKNILLGSDGSPHSIRAAQVTGELARQLKADVRVVSVFDPVPTYLGESNLQQVIVERMEEAEGVLQEAKKAIGNIPGKLVADVLEGPVAEAILTVAETRQIDLIVMGSRGLGKLTGLLLGSQSHKVVTHAPCPVLIVR